tara:strand:- start:3125 stop:3442 length:318 start_codon:yes stop_codon:yes gene_type:complete
MRKITADAISAFRNGTKFKRGNTQVFIEKNLDKQILHSSRILTLFGYVIAEMDSNGHLWISSAGWKTVTTKERLNGFPSVHIYQHKFEWYLNGQLWNGRRIKVEW